MEEIDASDVGSLFVGWIVRARRLLRLVYAIAHEPLCRSRLLAGANDIADEMRSEAQPV